MDTETPLTTSMGPTSHGQSQPALLGEGQLKQATERLREEIVEKILVHQNGVPTFCDDNLLELIKRLKELDKQLPWEESVKQLGGEGQILVNALQRLRLFLWRRNQDRFIDFQDRFIAMPEAQSSGSDIGIFEFAMSQGMADCLRWKGIPIFKTVFDFSIYTMMLWDLKPKTIIELGSGMGASAIWLADMMKAFEIDGHVYSVDLRKPALKHSTVSFIQGDCLKIGEVFSHKFLRDAPHPWLLIEDAHVNVYNVLCYFHPYFWQGDYVVVEDSDAEEKRKAVSRFITEHPNCYKVDTYYTDFFGRNATCAQDSIFARIS